MTQQQYLVRKSALEDDIIRLRMIHCNLSAKARIRKIAKLEFDFNGIPEKETLEKYNYRGK